MPGEAAAHQRWSWEWPPGSLPPECGPVTIMRPCCQEGESTLALHPREGTFRKGNRNSKQRVLAMVAQAKHTYLRWVLSPGCPVGFVLPFLLWTPDPIASPLHWAPALQSKAAGWSWGGGLLPRNQAPNTTLSVTVKSKEKAQPEDKF